METIAEVDHPTPSAGPVHRTDLELRAYLRRCEAKAEALGQDAVAARLDAWHARIQALRVQAHLAGLDARDEAAAPISRIELRLDHARDRLRQLAHESADVWTVLLEAYESVRNELVAAGELLEERPTR